MIESASQENSENSNASCDNISESEEGDGANMDTKGCDDYSSSGAAVPESIHSEDDCSLSGSDSHDSENEDDVAEGNVTYPRPVDNYSNPGSRHHQPPLPLSHPCNPGVVCDCITVHALSNCSVLPNGTEDVAHI